MFLWAVPVALIAFVLALFLPQVKLSDDLQPSARDLGEGFGLPEARNAEDRISQRVANLLYARGREGVLEMLEQADLGMDEGRVWALLQVDGLTAGGRTASVRDIAMARAVPPILLQPAFEDLLDRRLVRGDLQDLRMTATGGAAVTQLIDTFRSWVIGNLRDVDVADTAAVDAVVARIARRVVREEADSRPLVSVGIEPTATTPPEATPNR